MQKVKISRWGSPKIGYYTKLRHCKRNWDFSWKIVAPRNFFVFNGDFGGFQWGNFQNSEFAYYASKSGKCIKQTPTPPFWGDVGVKKWSQSLDLGTRSTTFGHLKMGTFENAPKNLFFCIFGRHSYRYNIYQVRMEFRKLFDILVRPNGHEQLTAWETTKRKDLHRHILTGCPWNHFFGCQSLKERFFRDTL